MEDHYQRYWLTIWNLYATRFCILRMSLREKNSLVCAHLLLSVEHMTRWRRKCVALIVIIFAISGPCFVLCPVAKKVSGEWPTIRLAACKSGIRGKSSGLCSTERTAATPSPPTDSPEGYWKMPCELHKVGKEAEEPTRHSWGLYYNIHMPPYNLRNHWNTTRNTSCSQTGFDTRSTAKMVQIKVVGFRLQKYVILFHRHQ
jgi:hypothetical protein